MDQKHTGEMLWHLQEQNGLLMDAYRSMSHELHKLQVEEEMLMCKFYELMSAQDLTKQNDHGNDARIDGNNDPGKARISVTPNE